MMDIGLPGALKKALDRGNPMARQQKKAEKIKEIDRQLEELVMESRENAGVEAMAAEPVRGPLTAVALTVGRMFRPARNESRMIDEQLSRVIAESETIDEPPQEAGRPEDKSGNEAGAKVPVAHAEAVLPPAGVRQEIGEKVNEVKADTVKPEEHASGKTPDGGSTANADKEKKPAAVNFRDDLMSKLAETAKVEKDVSLGIMRDMKSRKVNCDELQGDLQEISKLLKKSTKGNKKKSGG